MNYFVDTETCGYHGPIVLLQYAKDNGPIILHPVWERKATETIELMEEIANNNIIGFNLAFDWFHFIQMYTTLRVYLDRGYNNNYLDIEAYADCEPDARDYCCIRPRAACDIMLHARQTIYQSLMDRNNIYIKKVPAQLADVMVKWLNQNLGFEPIYFERLSDYAQKGAWRIQETNRPNLVNIYIKFAPSTRLKALAKNALGVSDPLLLSDIGIDEDYVPLELGYAPFARAVQLLEKWKGKGKKKFVGEWKGSWPMFIEEHIKYWGYNQLARKYASDDVDYTRRLWYFFGQPNPGDVDSDLACMVGAVRWKGFAIDRSAILSLKKNAEEALWISPNNKTPQDSRLVRKWLADALPDFDRAALPDSTDKETLKELITWGGEVAERAKKVLAARKATKQIEIYDKLLIPNRFHVSLKVIGTLSGRMAGADGMNGHGINKAKFIRKAFPLAFPDMELCGGDFDGFEVTIADAVYDEPKLRQELLTTIDCIYCDGKGCKECNHTGKEKKKIHATFGTFIYPPKTYKEIRLTSGSKEDDLYTKAKSGLFIWLFAGTEYAFKKNLGVSSEHASDGIHAFENFFPNVGKTRAIAMDRYSPLAQPDGIGTAVYKKACPDGVETLLGFKRYFTLEYRIIDTLFDLAQNVPIEWHQINIPEVTRSDRKQTGVGALQSACYSAAFGIQGKIRRVAINQPIQGTGAQITKGVQHKVWIKHQPVGVAPWQVIPMNMHDEIECPCNPRITKEVQETVETAIDDFKSIVPLLAMSWKTGMKSWADK